jgi:hypothetical protein
MFFFFLKKKQMKLKLYDLYLLEQLSTLYHVAYLSYSIQCKWLNKHFSLSITLAISTVTLIFPYYIAGLCCTVSSTRMKNSSEWPISNVYKNHSDNLKKVSSLLLQIFNNTLINLEHLTMIVFKPCKFKVMLYQIKVIV